MEFRVHPSSEASVPHRIVLVPEAPAGAPERLFDGLPGDLAAAARRLAAWRGFTGAPGQCLLIPLGECQWALAGTGDPGALTRPRYCEAVAQGLAALRGAGARQVALLVPEGTPWSVQESARYGSEALWMAAYAFTRHRSADPADAVEWAELVHEDTGALEQGAGEGATVGRALALTRDLINQPASIAHPGYVLDAMREMAGHLEARLTVVQGEELLRQGYGAIHAVGAAGAHPPALAALAAGEPRDDRPTVVLVGKGITFDSGGLDLKTSSAMALMKKDMGGAAIVLGGFQAIAELGLPVNLVAVVALAENLVGPGAFKPGDILRSKAGRTIEITNTDAEGRVVLADALALARTYRPHFLLDFATLTGACRVALGRELMGLFCNDEGLAGMLAEGAAHTGDALWRLPLWEAYRRKLDSPVADLANAPDDRFAGAITAALFLREFAGEQPWAHFDCYAWSEGDSPLHPKGGSAAGVRLLVDLAYRLTMRPWT